jgi:hypothetical protein
MNSASGQTSALTPAPEPRARGRRWIAGVITVALVGAGAIVLVATRGARPQAATAPSPGDASAVDARAPSSMIDAMPAAVPAPIAAAPADAGVEDAPPVPVPIDAAVEPPRRKAPRQPGRGGDHAGSAGSTPPTTIDRGD